MFESGTRDRLAIGTKHIGFRSYIVACVGSQSLFGDRCDPFHCRPPELSPFSLLFRATEKIRVYFHLLSLKFALPLFRLFFPSKALLLVWFSFFVLFNFGCPAFSYTDLFSTLLSFVFHYVFFSIFSSGSHHRGSAAGLRRSLTKSYTLHF